MGVPYEVVCLTRRMPYEGFDCISQYFFAMSISSKIKRYYEKSRTDVSQEQHTSEPERNSNSNSYNSTTSSISNSHNFSPANFIVFPYVDHEETDRVAGPSIRPLLEVVSRQLEAIQSQIKIPEAETETPSDSDEIPPISQAQSRAARQRMTVGDNSQTPRSKTLRPEYISAKRKGKRRRTEDTLNPAEPELENDPVVDDRPRKEKETTDEFIHFLYLLAFCAWIFFLISLFLLSVIFLFCLYVLHLSYK